MLGWKENNEGVAVAYECYHSGTIPRVAPNDATSAYLIDEPPVLVRVGLSLRRSLLVTAYLKKPRLEVLDCLNGSR